MRKLLFLFATLLCVLSNPCIAKDFNTDELLNWIKIDPGNSTPAHVQSMLGKPGKIEQSKKRTRWYYNHGENNVVISWSKKSDELLQFFFKCAPGEKPVFDNRLSAMLKEGSTDILQAIKLLGTPNDMTIKSVTQVVHYAYKNSVLRLFFRDRVLVDYTLLSQS